MPDLRVSEWLIILATIAGPILAVQAQKMIERVREKRQRRLHLFYTLMATRAARVSADHVQALNRIDLEFYGRLTFGFKFQFAKEKGVVEAWRTYQDHLNQQFNKENATAWITRGDDLFTELLYKIANALGFDFDRVQLKRGIYYPRAHDENEIAQLAIRDSLVKILTGTESLRMAVTSLPLSEDAVQRQEKLQEAMLKQLSGGNPIKVEIVNAGLPDSSAAQKKT